jgi:predicted RNA polymerase sigma factor
MAPETDDDTVELVFRKESGRAVAALYRLFGDIDVAEEAVRLSVASFGDRRRVL